MGNFVNKKLDLKLVDSEYYDFYLVNSDIVGDCCNPETLSGSCLVVWYDFSNKKTFNDTTSIDNIFSLVTWDGAINSGYTFDTFGLTGLDNGQLVYNQQPGDFNNQGLVDILTGTTLTVPANDKRLILNRVTGSTQQFVYPIELVNNPDGDTIRFCGGFYQGYYKLDNSTYEVLPVRTHKGWVADFWLKKEDVCTGTTATILNDIYPNNKGFFFYMGTRAENKFWNVFEGNNTGCTMTCSPLLGCPDTPTRFCTEPKETEMQIYDAKSGFNLFLDPPHLDIKEITNQFLIYGRAQNTSDRCGGCGEPRDNDLFGKETVCSFTGSSIFVSEYVRKQTDFRNQFLIYGRAKHTSDRCGHCGHSRDNPDYGKETVCSYSGDSEVLLELDKNLDVYDNAIGFRITDDGRVGYRELKYYCSGTTTGSTTGITVEEQYSLSGVVKDNQWTRITIRYVSDEVYTDEQLKCLPPRKGKLMIYVDCKLKAVFKNIDEFVARRLNDYHAKQVGVPFNISLGGGSQGLIETMTFDGQDSEDLGLLIEKNFAGTFIGQISKFKFNICDMDWCDISAGCVVSCDDKVTEFKKPIEVGIYFGKLDSKIFTSNMITQLQFSARGSAIKTYVKFNDESLTYNYILIPKDFKQPTNLKNSKNGCLGLDIPYLVLDDVNITFDNGNSTTYSVYRTVFKTKGLLDVWFCE
jgi:hypothetical protein